MHIAPDRMEAILDRRPALHLNEAEAHSYAGYITAIAGKAGAPPGAGPAPDVEEAAAILSERTGNTVVITLGERGCYYHGGPHNPGRGLVPGFSAAVINTIGAGDAHCGALIASLKAGKDLRTACETANRTGAAVVSGEA
jgi:sugar/nucleoside kinase (ribokinase family)